ncbi:MAG: DegV family protein [Lachnospiraceae bacterium]|nr:DegV family protein [Lachnospiraceae bacterium]
MTKIIADSTCDLSKELIEKYDVEILPLHILLGEKEYLDGVNISPAEIFAWSDENKQTPKTSAIDMNTPVEAFQKYLDEGMEIVCFSISDDMSTTGNIFRMAVEELEAQDKIKVVNSANLSTGIGLLVLEAAIMAESGEDATAIAARMEELKPLVRASFVVDTLVYLHRGGRCSGLAALAGGALKLHPRIEVADGKMRPGKKYRGSMGKAIMDYVKEMEESLKSARKDRVFITHSGCEEKVVSEVRAYLESLGHFDEISETVAGGVISSHCGPGTLGVLFIAQE